MIKSVRIFGVIDVHSDNTYDLTYDAIRTDDRYNDYDNDEVYHSVMNTTHVVVKDACNQRMSLINTTFAYTSVIDDNGCESVDYEQLI